MTSYRTEIEEIANQFDLDAYALRAQVLVESSGHTDAFRYEVSIWNQIVAGRLKPKFNWKVMEPRRVAGSYGLLQILYVTAMDMGFGSDEPELLFIPRVGLLWGATYLRHLLTLYKDDLERALAAYNGGPGAAKKKPYRTQGYVDSVFRRRKELRKEP